MRRCPLCLKLDTRLFHQDKKRSFHRCASCGMVFADGATHLPPQAIRQRYGRGGTQDNQRQLSPFLLSLLEQITSLHGMQVQGLNYGRVLDAESHRQVESAGHALRHYDPFTAPNPDALQIQYDFICCFRVFEHFAAPHREWQLFCRLLKADGFLAISTRMLANPSRFGKWHHKNNPAHVSFPCRETFEYLAADSGFRLIFAENDFILMQKPSGSAIKRDPISCPAL